MTHLVSHPVLTLSARGHNLASDPQTPCPILDPACLFHLYAPYPVSPGAQLAPPGWTG